MNQNNIRQHNGAVFSVTEAAAWLKELDDRTKSSQTGYNSINELATKIKSSSAKVTKDVVTVNNSTFTPIFKVEGDRLASAIRVSIQGTSGSVVVNVLMDVLVNHHHDIFIKSQSSFYTQLDIKVVTGGNEDFAVEIQTNSSSTSTSLAVEVFSLNSENVVFENSHNYSAAEHTHTTKKGVYISGYGGNSGDLTTDGNVTCTSLIQTSDKKFKKNIEEIDGEWALSVFKKLKFSFYDFSKTNSKQAGLIAQEVEKILPQAVHTSENGDKGLNHTYIDMVCKAGIQYFIKTQIQ